MTNYFINSTRVEDSTLDSISLGHETVKIRLAKKYGSKKFILNFSNSFYFLINSFNLISLGLFHDAGIYHNNNNQIVQQALTKATCIYKLLEDQLFISSINFLRLSNKPFKGQ